MIHARSEEEQFKPILIQSLLRRSHKNQITDILLDKLKLEREFLPYFYPSRVLTTRQKIIKIRINMPFHKTIGNHVQK